MHDEVAASLQPCVTPGTTDIQAPLEAQGRGFTHGHGKGHSIIGPTMAWLRRAVTQGLTPAVRCIRRALLETAVTVQFDAARLSGRQLGIDLRAEPFTARQQRQSRMDGGEEEDGTLRECVDVAAPVEPVHVERERSLAAALSRQPLTGTAAYRDLSLTGAFQSIFPAYRQRSSFCLLAWQSQPTLNIIAGPADTASSKTCHPRRLKDLFTVDEHGQILEILKPDGTVSSEADREADAKQWAAHFADDV
ncbi:MAG: hypothetical protein GY769_02535, partial [bacterium]|nr:hypothetical protein [bacterium]